jgi:hypothetical protein
VRTAVYNITNPCSSGLTFNFSTSTCEAPVTKILETSSLYATLQNAYDNSTNGNTMLSVGNDVSGDLLANRNVSVTLKQGSLLALRLKRVLTS